MKQPLPRESAPVQTARAATAISKDTHNGGREIAQVEKLLERFAKITIPDLWHYGTGLQQKKVDRVAFCTNPQLGQEVLEFWYLASELQRALWKCVEKEGGQQ
jgi:hypothetical protein